MDGQRDTVCSIIGTGLEVLSSPERMANASLRDITTAIGTLIDKWTMAAQAGRSREPDHDRDAREGEGVRRMKLVIDGPNEKQALFRWTSTSTSHTAGRAAAGRAGPCGRRRSSWRCGIRGSGF